MVNLGSDFADVNATYPGISRAPAVMSAFACAGSATPSRLGLGMTNDATYGAPGNNM